MQTKIAVNKKKIIMKNIINFVNIANILCEMKIIKSPFDLQQSLDANNLYCVEIDYQYLRLRGLQLVHINNEVYFFQHKNLPINYGMNIFNAKFAPITILLSYNDIHNIRIISSYIVKK
jgi:hypothetical protein